MDQSARYSRQEAGIVREGARRVWKHQRILWWFFFVNLLLGWAASMPYAARLGSVTGHSLHSDRLVNGFDYSVYLELVGSPDLAAGARWSESGIAIFIYFVFALFLTGGVLEAYAADRKLTTAEFFHACGAFFWRCFRLFLVMSVVLLPLVGLSQTLFRHSGRMILNAVHEKSGYWFALVVFLLTMILMMIVRLWFDMAQVRTVIDDEQGMTRVALRSFRFTLSNFGPLFWLYLRISALAWLGLAAGLWLWTRIPGRHSGLSFLVLEAVLFWWMGTRLWQRAAETVWYLRYCDARTTVPHVDLQPSLPISVPADPAPAN